MKNNKKIYAVNKQEDEDVEAYILYPENAIGNAKQEKSQQFIAGSKGKITPRVTGNQTKSSPSANGTLKKTYR